MSEEDKNTYVESIETRREAVKKEHMKLERVQRLNEATIEYVMNFMAKPAKLWRDSDLESRKAFQEILFPNGLHIDIKGRKCGTEDLSPLFSVMNTKKEPGNLQITHVVISAGGCHLLRKCQNLRCEPWARLLQISYIKKPPHGAFYIYGDLCGSNASHFLSASIIKK